MTRVDEQHTLDRRTVRKALGAAPAGLTPITEVDHLCAACINRAAEPAGGPLVHRAGAQNWRELPELSLDALRRDWGELQVEPQRTLSDNGAESQSLAQHIDYTCNSHEIEPLYLHWRPPSHVAEHLFRGLDLPDHLDNWFDALPDEVRPSMRWVLIGPAGSGTRMHVDIFGTSAWNAVLSGSKIWFFVSPDQLHAEQAAKLDVFADGVCLDTVALRYCIQRPGDLVIAPSGWWHQVRNLSPTLAVTENMVNATNHAKVRQWFIDHDRPTWASIIEKVSRQCLSCRPAPDNCASATERSPC